MLMVGMDEKEAEAAGRPAAAVTGTGVGLCLCLPSAFAAAAVAADAWLLLKTNMFLFVCMGGESGKRAVLVKMCVCVMMI